MGLLSRDLGINRATLYRWVGSREQLLVEVLWSLSYRTFEKLMADPATVQPGRGRSASVLDAWLHAVIQNPGMRAFVENEGDLALRLLTTRATDYQSRLLGCVHGLLAEDLDAERVRTEIPLEDLTYVVVRIIESYVYLSLITGEQPDAGRASRVLHALLPPAGPAGSERGGPARVPVTASGRLPVPGQPGPSPRSAGAISSPNRASDDRASG